MQETCVWSLGREDALEKEMLTHSSILAWRIPWTEEPGRLQSMGLLRVGHDWATSLSLSAVLAGGCFTIEAPGKPIYLYTHIHIHIRGFPCSSVSKESACNAGDLCLIPGLGRSPGEGNGNPLQYSWLENPMDRGAWQVTVHGVTRVGHDLVTKPPPPHIHTYNWITLLYA